MHRQQTKTLYLGLDPGDQPCVHYPVIRIEPKAPEELREALAKLSGYTHVLFTSQQTVSIFFDYAQITQQTVIAIGPKTAQKLRERGVEPICAVEHTQEGIVALLEKMDGQPSFFYPRSSIARPLLAEYLVKRGWRTHIVDLYETHLQKLEPVPNLEDFDRIVFTSPSTVQGFLKIYGELPKDKELVAIGPVTQNALTKESPP